VKEREGVSKRERKKEVRVGDVRVLRALARMVWRDGS
jgi:hypothetical protein